MRVFSYFILTLWLLCCSTKDQNTNNKLGTKVASSVRNLSSTNKVVAESQRTSFNEFAASNAIDASDTDVALGHINWAWGDHGPCTKFLLCATYIDHAGISFSDGNLGAFVKIQRLTTSAHDCIQNAKNALRDSNKALAVEWVMASQIHNRPVYDWLKGHGDAVVSALNACCR